MRPRPTSDRGSGTLSTVFGLGVFLTLLTFCSHLLVNLWAMSSVDAVAHDAATDVATSGAAGAEVGEVQARSIARARQQLGSLGGDIEFRFVDAPADVVALRVTAPSLSLLPGPVAAMAGVGGVDRVITVHREPPDPVER